MEKEILEPRHKYNHTPEENGNYDVIIVGTGAVGWGTAMYARRLGLKTLIIGDLLGGTITMAHAVENYPGFISISGPNLAKRIENHAKDYEIHILNAGVENIELNDKDSKKRFKVSTKNKSFYSKTIIYATGTKVKKLGVKGEKEFESRGLSYCALCDGPFTKGKTVAVVGGSDSAVIEALLLTQYAKKVYIIYRKDKVHPEEANGKRLEQCIKEGKIEIISNTNVLEIKGDKFLTEAVLDKPFKGKKELSLGALFVYVGRTPLSDLAKKIGVKVNSKEEVIINRHAETNISGFYAAGDITDMEFKQAIIGVGEGVTAAYRAYEFINKM